MDRACAVAKAAAQSATLTVATTTLYLKNDTRKNFSGKSAHRLVKNETDQISLTAIPDWKGLPARELALWSMVARLMSERPHIAPDTSYQLTEAQSEKLNRCREIMASHLISKMVKNAAYRNILTQVRLAARTVYRSMDWGWNEKVFQEALKTELDHISQGQYQLCSEIPHTISYRGKPMGDGVNARTDILLTERSTGRQVLLELKAVSDTRGSMDKAVQQCKRYLRMKQMPVGMVINFPDRAGVSVKTQVVFT